MFPPKGYGSTGPLLPQRLMFYMWLRKRRRNQKPVEVDKNLSPGGVAVLLIMFLPALPVLLYLLKVTQIVNFIQAWAANSKAIVWASRTWGLSTDNVLIAGAICIPTIAYLYLEALPRRIGMPIVATVRFLRIHGKEGQQARARSAQLMKVGVDSTLALGATIVMAIFAIASWPIYMSQFAPFFKVLATFMLAAAPIAVPQALSKTPEYENLVNWVIRRTQSSVGTISLP